MSQEINQTTTKLTEETPKTRKRKLLTDPESMWTSCQVCKEPGNIDNMVYHKLALKDQEGKELYGCFERTYFCSENCRGLFLEAKVQN